MARTRRARSSRGDRRAELLLGAGACAMTLAIASMIAFVAHGAWPTISHNGLRWLGSGGNLDSQLAAMGTAGSAASASAFFLRAWPLIYGTLLTAGLAVLFGLAISLMAAIFIAEFAPRRLRRTLVSVVRLLAAIPSVVYGLLGVLVLVPFVGNEIITSSQKQSVQNVIQLTGAGLIVAVAVLTLMITPIMTALITDALESVPLSWREGAIALGLNPLRATLAVSVRAIRPAIVAAAALASARAIGEAVAISMVSGGNAFSPKPVDGVIFLFEPLATLASEIIRQADGLDAPALRSSIYAIALLLLFSSFLLSIGSYLVKLPLRRYQVSR